MAWRRSGVVPNCKGKDSNIGLIVCDTAKEMWLMYAAAFIPLLWLINQKNIRTINTK
jgi:hypothetical protein